MPLTITFLGHSGFLFSDGENTLVVDPFLTGNVLAKHRPSDITCNYIAVTHGHLDHLGDTIEIAKRNDATVIATFELANYIGSKGVKKTEPANPGGKIMTDFGFVALTPAIHSVSRNEDSLDTPVGLVIRIDGTTVYHMGDTTIFSDMKLIGEIYEPDIVCIPIGDRFTMGPEIATRAAEMVGAKAAIPMHYGTFPALNQTSEKFVPNGIKVQVIEPGESWEYKE